MNQTKTTNESLDLRRQALITQCALERMMVAAEFKALTTPIDREQLRDRVVEQVSRFKIPLAIGAIALGLVVTRPGRALAMVTAATSLWKTFNNAAALVGRFTGRGQHY